VIFHEFSDYNIDLVHRFDFSFIRYLNSTQLDCQRSLQRLVSWRHLILPRLVGCVHICLRHQSRNNLTGRQWMLPINHDYANCRRRCLFFIQIVGYLLKHKTQLKNYYNKQSATSISQWKVCTIYWPDIQLQVYKYMYNVLHHTATKKLFCSNCERTSNVSTVNDHLYWVFSLEQYQYRYHILLLNNNLELNESFSLQPCNSLK